MQFVIFYHNTKNEWKQDLSKKQMEAETEEDYNSIELANADSQFFILRVSTSTVLLVKIKNILFENTTY